MTAIVSIKSKKLLKEMIKNGKANRIYISDPSVFGGTSGYLPEVLMKLEIGKSLTVCNRPHITGVGREWFGTIKLNAKGKIIVS